MKPIERRRPERFNLRIELSVSLLNSGAREQSTETLNISAGGMRFATNLSLRRSTAVQLHFRMPEEISHVPATNWVCIGRVVPMKPVTSPPRSLSVGVVSTESLTGRARSRGNDLRNSDTGIFYNFSFGTPAFDYSWVGEAGKAAYFLRSDKSIVRCQSELDGVKQIRAFNAGLRGG